jgi:DNA-binding response OmpR family regulator
MKVLLVEDELALSQSIQQFLGNAGILCEAANTFDEGQERILLQTYDCILLDLTLPGGNGLALLRKAKETRPETAVIILSARDSLDDKLQGFELGADDYLPKPFHLSELQARMKSVLRRLQRGGQEGITFDEITLFPELGKVMVKGEEISLTKKEFEMLHYFLLNAEKVLSKSVLAEHLWGDEMDLADSHDFLYSHIKNLRKKIAQVGGGDYLKTVYGMGYKLTTP